MFFFRLRKNLRALVVVHATWYMKAFLALLRPFIRYLLGEQRPPAPLPTFTIKIKKFLLHCDSF